MTSRQTHRRRGAGFEADIVQWFREHGYTAEQLHLRGTLDEGDVWVRDDTGQYHLFEAKAPGKDGRIDLPGWTREVRAEAKRFAAARHIDPVTVTPWIIVKARARPIGEAYLVRALSDTFG